MMALTCTLIPEVFFAVCPFAAFESACEADSPCSAGLGAKLNSNWLLKMGGKKV